VGVTLNGLTLTNGTGTSVGSFTYGGGVFFDSSFSGYGDGHPTITLSNCSVTQNSAVSGGGIWVYTQTYPLASLTLESSTVSANVAAGISLISGVAGIYASGALSLKDSIVVSNSAEGEMHACGGIGISGTLTIVNSTVTGNSAVASLVYGGYYYGLAVGGISTGAASGRVTFGNYVGSVAITNTTVAGNVAHGGSLAVGGLTAHDLIMKNTIVSAKPASVSPSGVIPSHGLWPFGVCPPCFLRPCPPCDPATWSITYSLVQGGWPGAGNVDGDPFFADRVSGNFRLLEGSPCIDAGSNPAVPLHVLFDLDGRNRFIEDSLTPDTGRPGRMRPIVDMGAYEGPFFPGRHVRRR
jgi:hypothetical protein